jgi:hypothetical protein
MTTPARVMLSWPGKTQVRSFSYYIILLFLKNIFEFFYILRKKLFRLKNIEIIPTWKVFKFKTVQTRKMLKYLKVKIKKMLKLKSSK